MGSSVDSSVIRTHQCMRIYNQWADHHLNKNIIGGILKTFVTNLPIHTNMPLLTLAVTFIDTCLWSPWFQLQSKNGYTPHQVSKLCFSVENIGWQIKLIVCTQGQDRLSYNCSIPEVLAKCRFCLFLCNVASLFLLKRDLVGQQSNVHVTSLQHLQAWSLQSEVGSRRVQGCWSCSAWHHVP